MATSEILNLNPQGVWKYFHELNQIPRPTGQMEEVTKFVMNFGKSLNLETRQDKATSAAAARPAAGTARHR